MHWRGRSEEAMDSRRGVRLAAAVLLLALAGCAAPTAKTQPPTPPPPSPAAATTPEQPATTSPPNATLALPSPPPAPVPAPGEPQRTTKDEGFIEEPALKDVLFEAGHTEIGRNGTIVMRSNARWLIEHAGNLILIEGHSDYTGTPEANLALGERRARAAMDFLVKAGVSETRIQMVSYGSDRPLCPQRTETCAARNRRAHFLVKPE